MNFINTFTADSTTAELAWESLGVTRSQMHGVRVRDEVFQGVQETLVLYQLGIDVVELGYTHSCCFAHVWIPGWLRMLWRRERRT